VETFCPENGDELLGACIESAVSLTNTAFTAFSAETRQHINALVFAGARVVLEIELTPCPSVVGSVYAHGQTIELFRVVQPPETQPEATH
jgi:hypothetical protein